MRALIRVGLTLLCLLESILGTWAQFIPRAFYDHFPTVNLDPPYSEHLTRDFGGATLGIAIILGVAAWTMERRIVLIGLIAYLAFALPHLIFHFTHLANFTPTEAIGLTVTLLIPPLGAATLITLSATRLDREHTSPQNIPQETGQQ